MNVIEIERMYIMHITRISQNFSQNNKTQKTNFKASTIFVKNPGLIQRLSPEILEKLNKGKQPMPIYKNVATYVFENNQLKEEDAALMALKNRFKHYSTDHIYKNESGGYENKYNKQFIDMLQDKKHKNMWQDDCIDPD